MRYLLPSLCIEKLHKIFVRSLLEYRDVIYDNCSNIDSTKIEYIQRRACIILTGVIRATCSGSISYMNQLGWSSQIVILCVMTR
jgi:hypothetical protein